MSARRAGHAGRRGGTALAGGLGQPSDIGRAGLVYVFLLAVFRVSGRRTLAQVTTFDLILVLILGDATQQALLGDDATFATTVVVVSTLVLVDIGLARAKHRWPAVDVIIDGMPLPLVVHGQRRKRQMAAEGVSDDDVLTAARSARGCRSSNRSSSPCSNRKAASRSCRAAASAVFSSA